MAMYDIHNHVSQVTAVNPQVIATDTTTVGNVVDMNNTEHFEALEIFMTVGLYTDGDYSIVLEESDDNSVFSAVDAANIVGTAAVVSADNTTTRLGYVGKKRYIRVSILSANTTTGATISAIGVRSKARRRPTQ